MSVLVAMLVAVAVVGLLIGAAATAGRSSDSDNASVATFRSQDADFDQSASSSGVETGSDEFDQSSSSSSGGSSSSTGSDPSSASPETQSAPVPVATVGRWILVLESVPKSESLASARSLRGRVDGGDPRVTVIDSDATPGMNPGYWVVAVLDFGSREAAVAECGSFGRDIGGRCYPTRVGDGAR